MPAMSLDGLDMFSRRGQEIVMVLYALDQLGGNKTKAEVLGFIREHRLYDLKPEDRLSYEGKREWRAETLLCFGRHDAVIGEWLFEHDERDAWELTREGRTILSEIIRRFRSGQWNLSKCFLWTPEFKQLIDASFVPSPTDAQRPTALRERPASERALALLDRLRRKLR
jgi:hypothetical protein